MDGSGEGPLDKPKGGGMVRLETEAGQLGGERPSGEKPGVGVHADMLAHRVLGISEGTCGGFGAVTPSGPKRCDGIGIS